MNQILITEKLYITPELKRKKKMYKFHFIISIFLVCILTSFYIYAEYDRNKSEASSQDILADVSKVLSNNEDDTIAKDDVLLVVLDGTEEDYDNSDVCYIYSVEDLSKVANETIDLQMAAIDVIVKKNWTQACDLVTRYFSLSQQEYNAGLLNETQFIGVIKAVEKLASLAAKTTCKDRWRQVLNEADRLRSQNKFLCTLQQGISSAQLEEMKSEKVVSVVPQRYIATYFQGIFILICMIIINQPKNKLKINFNLLMLLFILILSVKQETIKSYMVQVLLEVE